MPLKASPPPFPAEPRLVLMGNTLWDRDRYFKDTFLLSTSVLYVITCPPSLSHTLMRTSGWGSGCPTVDLICCGNKAWRGESDIKAMSWRQHTSCARWPLATNCTALYLSTGVALKMPIMQFLRSFKLPTVEGFNYFSYSAELWPVQSVNVSENRAPGLWTDCTKWNKKKTDFRTFVPQHHLPFDRRPFPSYVTSRGK